jgi:hypothetical protein
LDAVRENGRVAVLGSSDAISAANQQAGDFLVVKTVQ